MVRRLRAGGGSLLRTRVGNGARKVRFLGMSTGKMDPFPQRSAYLNNWYYEYFLNARLAAAAHFPLYQKRAPPRLGPNLFKTSGFLANYGSKAQDIGGLGPNDQSGVLWPAYPIQLWALAPRSASSSMQKRTPNPPTRGASPMRASDPQHAKRGVFLFVIIIAILIACYLTI
jgi:hypothetical protein